jgi:threonine dehydrogenase-like Zn-dependent dehydrogenase
MKAIVAISPGMVAVKNDVPAPEPGPYEALVRVHSCAFCNGTDMHIINASASRPSSFPLILGHEGCGEAVALGGKVRYIQIGDRFIRPDTRPQYGPYTSVYGNMAEYALSIDRRAMKEDGCPSETLPSDQNCGAIPGTISYEDGAVLLSLLECLSAVKNFGFRSGMDVLVFGAGPMGLGMIAFLLLEGAASVVLADIHIPRLAYAEEHFPAVKNIDVSKTTVAKTLPGQRFDMVIDLVGSQSILIEGSGYLKPGAKLCSMGVLGKTQALLDVTKLQNNTSLHMLNDPVGRLNYMESLFDMIQDGRIKPQDFYSHVLPAEKIEEGISLIKNKEALKVVFTF